MTGAACKPECSLEFMTYVPDEIRLVVRKLEQQVSALRPIVETSIREKQQENSALRNH